MAQISPFSLEFENRAVALATAEMIRDYRRQVVSDDIVKKYYYINRRGMEIEYDELPTSSFRDEFPLGEAGDVMFNDMVASVFEEIIANAKEATFQTTEPTISFLIVMAANKQDPSEFTTEFNMYILNNELTKYASKNPIMYYLGES
ncbi:hypothetical protein SPFM10_00150 [Salmonella phage SPFM10]|nr:hypothetical protein SPFM10_00150 [Salmonella phage SPFM10]